jgi:hypothetical protein
MSGSSHPDIAQSRPATWFARPGVVAALILAAVAWAAYMVVMLNDPDYLSSLEETSGYDFNYDPGVYVGFLIIAMVVPALICFFKGKVWMGLIGLFVPGVSLVGAFRSAKPDSLWAKRFPGKAPAVPGDSTHRATG